MVDSMIPFATPQRRGNCKPCRQLRLVQIQAFGSVLDRKVGEMVPQALCSRTDPYTADKRQQTACSAVCCQKVEDSRPVAWPSLEGNGLMIGTTLFLLSSSFPFVVQHNVLKWQGLQCSLSPVGSMSVGSELQGSGRLVKFFMVLYWVRGTEHGVLWY